MKLVNHPILPLKQPLPPSCACWISITHLQDPSFIRNVFAVTGISFLGLIAQMVRLWKVKVMSDMVLVMAGNLNPTDLRPIIESLLSSLKP